MMLDLAKRRVLAEQLRWLAGGRVTNDQFDDFLYKHNLFESDDAAIRTIAGWAWGLYSSDVLLAYRLKESHALGEAERAAAARGVLFLRSSDEYQWPEYNPPGAAGFLDMLSGFCVPLGGALAIITLFLGFNEVRWVGEDPAWIETFVWLLLVVATWLAARHMSGALRRYHEVAYSAAGDLDCWPFFSQHDLAQAKQHGHLVAK